MKHKKQLDNDDDDQNFGPYKTLVWKGKENWSE